MTLGQLRWSISCHSLVSVRTDGHHQRNLSSTWLCSCAVPLELCRSVARCTVSAPHLVLRRRESIDSLGLVRLLTRPTQCSDVRMAALLESRVAMNEVLQP